MSKRQVLMIVGVLVIIIPFLGFPPSLQKFLIVFCGLLVTFIAYSMAPKVRPIVPGDMPFSEHKSASSTPVEQPSQIISPNPAEQK